MNEFLRKWKKAFTWAAVFSLFANLLMLTFPFYMFTIYSNILSTRSLVTLKSVTFVALLALAFFGLFFLLRARLLSRAGADLSQTYREQALGEGLQDYARVQGRAYTQGTQDLETLRNYFSSPAMFSLFDAPFVPLYLLVIFFFHHLLGLIATVGALLMVGLSILQEILVRNKIKRANAQNARNTRFVNSVLRNAEAVNAMGMMPNVVQNWRQKQSQVIGDQSQASLNAGAVQAVLKPLQTTLQVCIYGSGAVLVLQGRIGVSTMVISAIMMGRAVQPLMQAISAWKQTSQALEAYNRLHNYLYFKSRKKPQTELPRPRGYLTAQGATAVVGGYLALRGVNLQLNPGEFMALIGPSGAGKSTLCRVLLGTLPPVRGRARLDGMDTALWDKDQLGQHIGYLPQEIELFQGTVGQNIARMQEPDSEKVQQAAKLAGVHEFLQNLPQGYQTLVGGETGIGFSGGERQRLGLARALYGDPVLLVLDEPNSNLDEAGEAALHNTLQDLKQNLACTCVLVSHQPGLLTVVDKILMLRQGQVAMFGPRDQVLQKLSKISPMQQKMAAG